MEIFRNDRRLALSLLKTLRGLDSLDDTAISRAKLFVESGLINDEDLCRDAGLSEEDVENIKNATKYRRSWE